MTEITDADWAALKASISKPADFERVGPQEIRSFIPNKDYFEAKRIKPAPIDRQT